MTKTDNHAQPISPVRSIMSSRRSSANHAHRAGRTSNGINPILVFNVTLLGIAILTLSFYVIQANMVATNKYKVQILNEKLVSLNEVRTSLTAQRSETEDLSMLMKFAVSRNMVEAKNITYLFENGDVALKQ